MKRIYFGALAVLVTMLGISSCGEDAIKCPSENDFVGNYDGSHAITLPSLGFAIPQSDSLYVTNPVDGDNILLARSVELNATLTCRISPDNCKKVLIDTVVIDSAKISGITIKDVVASGDGDINGNQLVTRIKVISGTAYDIPIYGDQDLVGTRINGIFNK